jgi:hypothetical protein
MGYIHGEGRNQATLFPVVLDECVPADHVCRVIDAVAESFPAEGRSQFFHTFQTKSNPT